MKLKLGERLLILSILLLLSGCSKRENLESLGSKEIKSKSAPTSIKIFPTKVNRVVYKDGEFIISGSSKAPNNSKIMIEVLNKNTNQDNSFKISNKNDWATVNKGRFTVGIDTSDVSEKNVCKVGDIFYIKVFAVMGIEDNDTTITKKMKNIVKGKEYRETKLNITNEVAEDSIKKKEQADIEDSINEYELELDNSLEDFELDSDDIAVKFDPRKKQLNVDLSTTVREAYDSDELVIKVLETVKTADLNSVVRVISVTIHARNDKDKGNATTFLTSNVKKVDWEKVKKLEDYDISNVVDDLKNGTLPNLSLYDEKIE